MKKISLVIIAALLTISWECKKGCKDSTSSLYTFSGFAMGTTYSIKIFLPREENPAGRRLEQKVKEALDKIEARMSVMNSESEIARFNRFRKTEWFPVSKETAFLVKKSIEISELTGGAFDITIGPLVNIWGFGSGANVHTLPHKEVVEKTRKTIGYKNLEARISPPALRKRIPELCCTLAAIAKGYGVDSVAELLEKNGIIDFIVEIGGEVKASGAKPGGRPWRIGIAAPSKGQQKIQLALNLSNNSVATSGDYQNYFEKNGVRYSHTIDPRTGFPVSLGLASVTVVHGSCMYADAMATAINVMGPVDGFNLAEKRGLAVYLIERRNGKLEERMTPEFRAIIDGNTK